MHWVLQDNLFHEEAYGVLLETLVRFDLPHSIHKVVPFVGELIPEPEITTKNVICMGSYSLRHAAKKYGWNPGVFDLEPFDFRVQMEHWGHEMLNADAVVVPFKDAVLKRTSFLRPIEDSKVFPGRVYDPEEFEDWQRKVCVLEEDYGNSLTKDTLIQICQTKVIHSEYRFWVVRGKIVCASLYKQGDRVFYTDVVPGIFFEYVKDRIAEWQPHDAFVVDVASCEEGDGIRIVEINTLNSCGFYACDIQKLVMALENGFNEHG